MAVICPLVSRAQDENERTLEAVALDPHSAAMSCTSSISRPFPVSVSDGAI